MVVEDVWVAAAADGLESGREVADDGRDSVERSANPGNIPRVEIFGVDVLEVGNDAQCFDALNFDARTAEIELLFVGGAGAGGLGDHVGWGKWLGGVDETVVPEDGIGKGQDGCDLQDLGDGHERNGEGSGDADLVGGLRGNGVDVEVDEESEHMMCTLKEAHVASQ